MMLEHGEGVYDGDGVQSSQVPRPSCVEGRENEGHIACE